MNDTFMAHPKDKYNTAITKEATLKTCASLYPYCGC